MQRKLRIPGCVFCNGGQRRSHLFACERMGFISPGKLCERCSETLTNGHVLRIMSRFLLRKGKSSTGAGPNGRWFFVLTIAFLWWKEFPDLQVPRARLAQSNVSNGDIWLAFRWSIFTCKQIHLLSLKKREYWNNGKKAQQKLGIRITYSNFRACLF